MRSPENTTSHPPCQLPNTFNAPAYNKLELNNTLKKNLPDFLTEVNNTQCRPTGDGTLCVNPKCHYREYSVGFAFEGALIFLCAPGVPWLAGL